MTQLYAHQKGEKGKRKKKKETCSFLAIVMKILSFELRRGSPDLHL
jgi:hypothetical protein